MAMICCCSLVGIHRPFSADRRRPVPSSGGPLVAGTCRLRINADLHQLRTCITFFRPLSVQIPCLNYWACLSVGYQLGCNYNLGYGRLRWVVRGASGGPLSRSNCGGNGYGEGGVDVVSGSRAGVVRGYISYEGAMASSRKLPKLQGTLFKYGNKSIQVAFKTGDYKQQVIFIGGLTDGFFATDYVELLAKALEAEKWSLVQPLFTSSYTGFGTSSLKEDATEIEQLLNYLIYQEQSEGFILVGHSTGCQDIVHYLRTGGHCSRAVRGAILQAPVSDREYRATLPETQPMLEMAMKMVMEGQGEELMPRKACPEAPITANRYRSLCAYLEDDDLFSSDFSDAQLKARLGHMARVPCQVIFSMADEYVPDHVDKVALLKRLCEAMGGADKVAIPWGNHSLSNRVDETVRAMIAFIKKGGPKGWDDPWG